MAARQTHSPRCASTLARGLEAPCTLSPYHPCMWWRSSHPNCCHTVGARCYILLLLPAYTLDALHDNAECREAHVQTALQTSLSAVVRCDVGRHLRECIRQTCPSVFDDVYALLPLVWTTGMCYHHDCALHGLPQLWAPGTFTKKLL